MSFEEFINGLSEYPLLSKEETEALFIQRDKGDKESRNKLITHNIRRVVKIANTYIKRVPFYNLEEIVSIGLVGLVKAVDFYCLEKGFEFSTYAHTMIENHIKSEIDFIYRKKRNRLNEVSIENLLAVGSESSGELTIESTLESKEPTAAEMMEKECLKEEVREMLEILTPREKEVILLRFGFIDEKNYLGHEAGELLGISRQRVFQLERSALKKLSESKKIKHII